MKTITKKILLLITCSISLLTFAACNRINILNINEAPISNKISAPLEEWEAYKEFSNRGFDANNVYAELNEEGEFGGRRTISQYSEDIHPIYCLSYISPNAEIWRVCLYQDQMVAYPYSYEVNGGNAYGTETIISESEELSFYNSSKNEFEIRKPKKDEAEVKVVNRVDSKTLNSLTVSELRNDPNLQSKK